METIMVQEADAATLDMVATALQIKGYRVCSLDNSDENVLEMIRRHHPKLVLLDCWLSHNSAGQVSQWIKAHFPLLPVIAFSCDNQIEAKYRQFGFDDYIQQPFEPDKLYQVIRKHLFKRHRRRRTGQHA